MHYQGLLFVLPSIISDSCVSDDCIRPVRVVFRNLVCPACCDPVFDFSAAEFSVSSLGDTTSTNKKKIPSY